MKIIRWSATYDEVFDYPRPLYRNSREVLEYLSKEHNISKEIIVGKIRKDKFVKIRHEFFYMCMCLPGMSANKLGGLYGFNHATILHGISAHAHKNDLPALTRCDANKSRTARLLLYHANKERDSKADEV